jgi:HEPN domain-containing protein
MQLQPSDSSLPELLPEDDIDQLFQKLPRLEVPGDLVKQILARIEQLPIAQRYPQNVSQQADLEASEKAEGMSS